MQVMDQVSQMINAANASCEIGTDCYNQQRIVDTKNAYDAAVITEKKAPEMVEVARKNYLVATKGQTAANEVMQSRYEASGQQEKASMTQQFDEFYDGMSAGIKSVTVGDASIRTSGANIDALQRSLYEINEQGSDASNALNLLMRKIDYASQDVNAIRRVEHYVKLAYWLAFMTWAFCIIYERRFTMKTGGLFVLFTLIILLQNRIMDGLSFIIPADVTVIW